MQELEALSILQQAAPGATGKGLCAHTDPSRGHHV